MTMTKKQRRLRGIDRPALVPAPGALPWKALDVQRQMGDGSTELVRWAIVDAAGAEVVHDVYSEAHRNRIVNAVNLHRSAGGEELSPQLQYLDPMSILEDSRDILDVALESREAHTGERDTILRDLIKRIKRVVGER